MTPRFRIGEIAINLAKGGCSCGRPLGVGAEVLVTDILTHERIPYEYRQFVCYEIEASDGHTMGVVEHKLKKKPGGDEPVWVPNTIKETL